MSSAELSKSYEPTEVEARWSKQWLDAGLFTADPDSKKPPFCIVLPPPNVTGSLHLGHALTATIQDILTRYKRMSGFNCLWLPGTDHAGIATQMVVEKELMRAEKKTRHDLGRDAFLERVWAWKKQYGERIGQQHRLLGASLDWSRERFTMDPGLSEAVKEVFVRLHQDGLIYRANRLINWDPALRTALSDLEVENEETNGTLWSIAYPVEASAEKLIVATTRPETMLGDTAVAVNPADPRYSHLVGRTIELPLVDRRIPIVADEHVDPAFGTGCVKVTPAHDPNDFAIGQRHGLPQITVMAKDGSMNEAAGRFAGLDRFEARKAVVAAMEAEGLLVKVEPHRHSVPFSDRGKVPVEPLLSTQWFVRTEPLAARCRTALDNPAGAEPRFVPERWSKVYRDWLTDIRDWCISRQLWWGHRIPAWFVVSETGGVITEATPYVVARDEAEAWAQAEAQFAAASLAAGRTLALEQDPDVLDTWFSSGLWPFSTLGWPGEGGQEPADLATWYPTSVLVTGFDIIFFWVARMTMLAGAFLPEAGAPFGDVYIHGLVRDENNRKMSKSAGNGIDPLLLIERYGADALRFALVREVAGAGQDIRLDYDRKTDTSATVEAARNFANKLFNATRFALMNLGGETPASLGEPVLNELESEDRWILSRLVRTSSQCAELYGSYRLGEAAKLLYEFAWNDLCDQYIEWAKPRLFGDEQAARNTARQVLAHSLESLLVMLHPLMPHLSEDLWHAVTGAEATEFLALQRWPQPNQQWLDPSHESAFQFGIDAVRAIRNLRALSGVKPAEKLPIGIHTPTAARQDFVIANQDKISRLVGASELHWEAEPTAGQLLGIVDSDAQVGLTVPQQSLDALRERLQKDLAKVEKEIAGLQGRLANPNFAGKAPAEVVAECQANLAEARAQAELLRGRLGELG